MTDVLKSKVKTAGSDFKKNREHHLALIQEVQEATEQARRGGGEEAVARHHKRNKLLPRERIDRILDPGSPFMELSPLAAHGMYDGAAPSAAAGRWYFAPRPGRDAGPGVRRSGEAGAAGGPRPRGGGVPGMARFARPLVGGGVLVALLHPHPHAGNRRGQLSCGSAPAGDGA